VSADGHAHALDVLASHYHIRVWQHEIPIRFDTHPADALAVPDAIGALDRAWVDAKDHGYDL
jgi:hypothetical protein